MYLKLIFALSMLLIPFLFTLKECFASQNRALSFKLYAGIANDYKDRAAFLTMKKKKSCKPGTF